MRIILCPNSMPSDRSHAAFAMISPWWWHDHDKTAMIMHNRATADMVMEELSRSWQSCHDSSFWQRFYGILSQRIFSRIIPTTCHRMKKLMLLAWVSRFLRLRADGAKRRWLRSRLLFQYRWFRVCLFVFIFAQYRDIFRNFFLRLPRSPSLEKVSVVFS